MNGKKGVVIQGRAREIIYNIDKVFESEKLRANELLRKLNLARIHETLSGISISPELFDGITEFLKASTRVTDRVVLCTGVNKNTVTRIRREGTEAEASGTYKIITPVKKPRGKSVVLDNNDLNALSKLITRLYMTENVVPSLRKILAKARSDLNFQGGMTTLRRILVSQLGYKYTRGLDKSKQITIIRPNITDDSEEDIETEYLTTEIEEYEPQDNTTNTINETEDLEEMTECSNIQIQEISRCSMKTKFTVIRETIKRYKKRHNYYIEQEGDSDEIYEVEYRERTAKILKTKQNID